MVAPARTSFPKSEISVLLLENIHASADELFGARGEGWKIERASAALREGELIERIRDVHVLGIRSKTRVTPAVLAEARRLLAIGAFCIGTNQIALDHGRGRGVPAFNAPFSNTRSVAEMILAEIVVLSRQLFDRSHEVHAGTWKKIATGCHEVRGKTLGIVGLGTFLVRRATKLGSFLIDAAYWVFVTHLIWIGLAVMLLRNAAIMPELKMLIVALFSAAMSLATYIPLRRTKVGRWLGSTAPAPGYTP